MENDTTEAQENLSAKGWLDQIEAAHKARSDWESKAKKINKRYRDERDSELDDSRRLNILWSNIQTLKPALFSAIPVPYVRRRFKDSDPVGRQASEILERATSYCIDSYDFENEIQDAVENRLLPGMGQARITYQPTYGDPEPVDPDSEEMFTPVVYEETRIEYVHWTDFLILGKPRRWKEADGIAFRSFLSRKELIGRFGEKVGRKVKLDHGPEKDHHPESDEGRKATVYEIWDKANRKVHWVAKDYDFMLESGEPPLDLVDFWPCPRPIFATTTTDTMIPVPDYVMYQDQAEEIDQLTNRIDLLVGALRVAGVYGAGEGDGAIEQLVTGEGNQLIPVSNWAMFAEKGGLDKVISWLPLEQILTVLQGLYQAREDAKQAIYEITGLSDLVRGQSKASETATAQRIKGQFATARLGDMQDDVARFVRDLIRLKAEVIADLFSAETLETMTGLKATEEVMELLRNDLLRGFRIDIETDSTVQADEQADKEARIEFLRASSEFMATMQPIVAEAPNMAELAGKMLLFGVRGFKVGRELEDAFESAIEQTEQDLAQPPQPTPEQVKDAKELELQEREQSRKEAETQSEIAEREMEMAHAPVHGTL